MVSHPLAVKTRSSSVAALFCLLLAFSSAHAQVIISEFNAQNFQGHRDNDLEFTDWIELHNTTGLPVNLNGWRLTDDATRPAKWVIPSTNIGPRGFLVIYASGKNRTTPGAVLHTSFSLNDSEYLALSKPDGTTTSIFTPRYPAQVPDVSYGLAFNGTVAGDAWRYFDKPTPGAANGPGFSAVAAPVSFSEKGGVYTNNLTVTLSSANPNAVIKYTLDGRDPGAITNAITYTSPLSVTDSRYIRARAFEADKAPSPVRSEAYTLLGSDLVDFTSNLPILVVNSFGRGIPENTRITTYATLIHTNGARSSLLQAPNYRGRARMAIRGSSSTQFPKKSYAFETNDEQDSDLKVSLLGLPEESDWVLYAPYTDKTLMRDVLAYEMSNRVGRYAPRARFIEVYVDTGNKVTASDYVGVYVLLERIRRDENRVDIDELLPSMNSLPEISGGYILKIDRLNTWEGESGLSLSRAGTLAYVEPEEEDATPAQKTWIRTYLNGFETNLFSSSFRTGYNNYIDVDSFVDNLWLVEAARNIDGYRLSTFLYKPRNGKLRLGPAWDYNLSFGNADYLNGWLTDGWYYPESGGASEWLKRLMLDSEFKQRMTDLWQFYRREHWRTEQIHAQIDAWVALLSEAQVRDQAKWKTLGRYIWPNKFVGKTYAEEINFMKGWITGRFNWIDNQHTLPPSFSVKGDESAGVSLVMQAPRGQVLYTLDGSDPRARTGTNSPKALTFSSGLALNQELLITARAKNGTNWSGLVQTAITPLAAWKTLHFTSEEQTNQTVAGDFADPDADGVPNWQEYAAGTNPRSAADVLRLEGSVRGGRSVVSFKAMPGKSYTLQRLGTLGSIGWLQAASFPASVQQVTNTVDVTSTNKQTFYRLIVHP